MCSLFTYFKIRLTNAVKILESQEMGGNKLQISVWLPANTAVAGLMQPFQQGW